MILSVWLRSSSAVTVVTTDFSNIEKRTSQPFCLLLAKRRRLVAKTNEYCVMFLDIEYKDHQKPVLHFYVGRISIPVLLGQVKYKTQIVPRVCSKSESITQVVILEMNRLTGRYLTG